MSDAISQEAASPLPAETGITPASAVTGITTAPDLDAPDRNLVVARHRPRLWPGVVLVVLQWLAIKGPGWFELAPMTQFYGMMFGPMLGAAAIVIWWLFFSRVPWTARLFALGAFAAVGVGAFFLAHPSYKMGMTMMALPVATTAWVVWMLATPFLSLRPRVAGLVIVFVLSWGYFTLLRMDGVTGAFAGEVSFRWSPTSEEKFLAEMASRADAAPAQPVAEALVLQPGDWPGFRGAQRDSRLTGVRIATDWKQQKPRELWRKRVGPGWSSFAVVGHHVYTQEQRGPDEVVVCYHADTGDELWTFKDPSRFAETVSGPGPRATPTFHEGRLYALGARGNLHCLDAATGEAVWSRDVAADSGAKVPTWGFSSSPLVAGVVVSVLACGPEGKSVMAYHLSSGEPAWHGGEGHISYCSTQLARLGGVEQVLIVTETGLTSFQPETGEVLWKHDWRLEQEIARVVQPAVVDEATVLLGTPFNMGTRRVHVSHDKGGWTTEEEWTTKAISPYFNDLVLHKGHLYGFEGTSFTCVRLEDGKGRWKARGYANGQVLLLADQDLLLILTEGGDVALVEANPERQKELGRFHALDGKTWNHPVLAHGKLFVRNGEEMACYKLPDDSGK